MNKHKLQQNGLVSALQLLVDLLYFWCFLCRSEIELAVRAMALISFAAERGQIR